MTGQAAAVPQAEQVLPRQREPAVLGEGEAGIAGALGAGAEALVQDGESGIDERHDVAGGENEAVAEAEPRPADVPAHRPGQEQREEHVHLGPRAAGVPALAVVQLEIDALVDQVLEDLIAGEVALRQCVHPLHAGPGPGAGAQIGCRHDTSTPRRAWTIGSTTARVRFTASAMFSRELA